MAEARSAADLFFVQKKGFLLYGQDDHEDGYVSVRIKLPTPSTVLKATSLLFRRAKYQLTARVYPATPTTVLAVMGGVTATTVSASSDSWLRSGWLAEVLWKADKSLNALNPLHKHFSVNTRVAYLAAVAAFVGMVGIVTVERVLLKVCLSWQGWLYLPPGTKRKPWSVILWAAGIKALSGKKNLTYAFEMSLPSLPLPSLRGTCERYLETVRPLLSDDEFAETEETTTKFLANEGPRLQRYLWFKHLWAANYVTDWWEKYVYLRGRTPLMINSNYYVLDSNINLVPDQIKRASNIVHQFIRFKDMIEHETLEPMVLNGLVPLCMSQYSRMFGTCRIPGRDCDKLKNNVSRYIVVIREGHFYRLDVYHGARGTHLKPYSVQEIYHQLQLIEAHSKRKSKSHVHQNHGMIKSNRIQSYDDLVVLGQMHRERKSHDNLQAIDEVEECLETDIAAFTAGPRSRWAEVREVYFGEGINRESLRTIEKAAFILNLESEAYDTVQDRASSLFHGSGANRWFDKSINLVVFADGHAGLNSEHSWADAPAVAHMWEFSLLSELRQVEQGDLPEADPATLKRLPTPKRLVWDIDTELNAAIAQSKRVASELIEDISLEVVEHAAFGKGFMKKCKLSPDAFIQMALQLAYFNDRGRCDLTYEASMTRLYRHGRTETVRSLSTQSAAFVGAFYDKTKSKQEKIDLLYDAAKRHQDSYRNAMTGKGVDRHLFALYVVSKGMDVESPFLNQALSVPWKLSTSQQPQQQTMLRKELSKEVAKTFVSPGGGFGPVADDGYGVSYMIVGEDLVYFHVSSKISAEETDSKRFGGNIVKALADMKSLFESTD